MLRCRSEGPASFASAKEAIPESGDSQRRRGGLRASWRRSSPHLGAKIAPNSNEANPYRLARSRRWESGSRSYSALVRSMTLRKTRSIRPRAREDEDVLTLEGTAVVVEARLAPVARRASPRLATASAPCRPRPSPLDRCLPVRRRLRDPHRDTRGSPADHAREWPGCRH